MSALPYPSNGAVTEVDKFVRVVGVEGASVDIAGFYVDIGKIQTLPIVLHSSNLLPSETFSPGVYRKTSSKSVPELNVLVVSHRTSAITDLLNGIRALAPTKFSNLYSRPWTEEPLTGYHSHTFLIIVTNLLQRFAETTFCFATMGNHICRTARKKPLLFRQAYQRVRNMIEGHSGKLLIYYFF